MPLGFVLLCARVLLPSNVHIILVLFFRFYFYFYVHCPSKNDEFSYYAKQFVLSLAAPYNLRYSSIIINHL